MGDLTRVTINFDTSHLIFPAIIGSILVMLGIAILITRRHAFAHAGRTWSGIMGRMDKVRFFGTIALTIVYFSLMVPIGYIWPNTGMGFLICSIPYVFLTDTSSCTGGARGMRCRWRSPRSSRRRWSGGCSPTSSS